jgi:hypothetical protein
VTSTTTVRGSRRLTATLAIHGSAASAASAASVSRRKMLSPSANGRRDRISSSVSAASPWTSTVATAKRGEVVSQR